MTRGQDVFTAADLALLARDEGPLKALHSPARLAIFGDPVAHSLSPRMHNAAIRERQRDAELRYVPIQVTPRELPEALANLGPAGFLGISLTIPHKQAALPLMDEVEPTARLMGAINTVLLREGRLLGYNTDGPGFSAAVRESFGIPLSSLRVLILGGAGGAGRAITIQCVREGCPSITVANRNREKGAGLADEIRSSLGSVIRSVALETNHNARDTAKDIREALLSADLIINATPLGMKAGDPSPLPGGMLRPDHLVYDTVYSGGETALLRMAREAGASCTNGFSMLLHQGILQNALWLGEPAPIEAMRAALKTT